MITIVVIFYSQNLKMIYTPDSKARDPPSFPCNDAPHSICIVPILRIFPVNIEVRPGLSAAS